MSTRKRRKQEMMPIDQRFLNNFFPTKNFRRIILGKVTSTKPFTTNECPIINGPLLHFSFSSFNPFYKKKIHHRMQREKLYNLYRTANFTVVGFVSKIDKIMSDQIPRLRKVFAQNCALFENKKYCDALWGERPNSICGCNLAVIDICPYLSFSFVLLNAWVFKYVIYM